MSSSSVDWDCGVEWGYNLCCYIVYTGTHNLSPCHAEVFVLNMPINQLLISRSLPQSPQPACWIPLWGHMSMWWPMDSSSTVFLPVTSQNLWCCLFMGFQRYLCPYLVGLVDHCTSTIWSPCSAVLVFLALPAAWVLQGLPCGCHGHEVRLPSPSFSSVPPPFIPFLSSLPSLPPLPPWCSSRGYSETERPPNKQDYRIDLLKQDIVELIPALGYSSCTLVAHDWGGVVAWWGGYLWREFDGVCWNCQTKYNPCIHWRKFFLLPITT